MELYRATLRSQISVGVLTAAEAREKWSTHLHHRLSLGRCGHVAAFHGRELMMWGGYTDTADEGHVYYGCEELLRFNVDSGALRCQLLTTDAALRRNMSSNSGSAGVLVPSEAPEQDACEAGANLFLTFGFSIESPSNNHNAVLCVDLAANRIYRHFWPRYLERNLDPDALSDEEFMALIDEMSTHPSPRDKHSAFQFQNRLYVFGGFGPSLDSYLHEHGEFQLEEDQWRGWNNQLLVYEISSRSWSNPSTSGSVPTPRAAHFMERLNDGRAILVGGRSRVGRHNDVFLLQLDHLQWSSVRVLGSVPRPRSWMAGCLLAGPGGATDDARLNTGASRRRQRRRAQRLFLHGGFSDECVPLADAFIFDVPPVASAAAGADEEASIFSYEVDVAPPHQEPLLWHQCCALDDGRVVVSGGCQHNLLQAEPDASGAASKFLDRCLLLWPAGPASLQQLGTAVVAASLRQPDGAACAALTPWLRRELGAYLSDQVLRRIRPAPDELQGFEELAPTSLDLD